MATFDALVPLALPFLASETIEAVQGKSWQWDYDIAIDGDPVDFTGCTGVCQIRSQGTGALIVAPTVSFPADGVVRCIVTPSESASLAPGGYLHEVEVTKGPDQKVPIVGGGKSRFVILPKGIS